MADRKPPHGSEPSITPRIIIHGGAGNITRANLPPHLWRDHQDVLLSILRSTQDLLQPAAQAGTREKHGGGGGATALEAAVHAVTLLEDDAMFNCGRGAVFTRAGTIELEASVMVTSGFRKRGCGVMMLKHVKHPIQLAAELLKRGDDADGKGGGAYGHVQLAGEEVERLAEEWGLEMCDNKYFWTKKRWDEHRKGINEGWACAGDSVVSWADDDPGWDGKEYLPQGTVGCVVLDRFGTICVATSTGGITNKLPGRIGDTPTLGAGFWAEEWSEKIAAERQSIRLDVLGQLARTEILGVLRDCLWPQSQYNTVNQEVATCTTKKRKVRHAVGMSGTGNGDSFLRLSAARTAAAMSRFSSPCLQLSKAVSQVVGTGGELQKSAGDRWGDDGEGEGGIIGIELVGDRSQIVWDFNCGGMFRAYIDADGLEQCMVFKEPY